MTRGHAGPSATPRTALGRPRVHLRRTGSTNDHARALAIAGAPHGTLVSAAEQTAGRGRQGRRWSAPAHSSVLASLVLRPGEHTCGTGGSGWVPQPTLLPLIAAVAVCDAVGEPALIKWPNDVVVPDRGNDACASSARLAKLAGILVEGRPQEGWAVLGIGVNVAVQLRELPVELRADRTADAPSDSPNDSSSAMAAATLGLDPSAVEPTLARLLDALERRLAQPAGRVLEAWRERDALRGREVRWAAHDPTGHDGLGRAAGIDGEGRLLVQLAGGRQVALSAGEVHLALTGTGERLS